MSTPSDPASSTASAPGLVRLPADRRRPPGSARRPLGERTADPEEPAKIGAMVRAEAERAGTGTDAVLLAAYAALLARWTAQSRVAFGFTAAGRPPRLLVLDTASGTSFAQLVRQVAERLRRAPDPATGPDHAASVGFARGGPADAALPPYGELWLRVADADADAADGELLGALDVAYDGALFDEETARRFLGHYRTLLAGAVADPGLALARLPLLTEAETHRMLVEWNDTRTELPLHDGTLHGAFARHVERRPDAVAVVDGERRVTYAEADAAANRLARHLRALGVARETPVGLSLPRSAEFLVAALAVLKAGGAYVPLDPAYPRARLRTMLADARCPLVVTLGETAGRFGLPPERTVRLDTDAAAIAAHPDTAPDAAVAPDDLCYIIFTSGSTGRPKGIALRHAGVLNNLLDIDTRYEVGPGDAVLAVSSPSFDMSVYEFLGMAVSGATVVVPDRGREKDPAHWAELIRTHRITLWNSAPSLYELLVTHAERAGDADLTSLRLSLCGGDWIPVALPERIRAHAPGLRFIALGGATEASIHSTVHEVVRTDPDRVSIPYGRPMANQRTYVLDAAGRPVPVGVPGELYLAGDGLARGYLGEQAVTDARFGTWSHGPVTDERLYRTGDLARYDADGLLELLGRIDFQVKIRGVRVETGEVEAAVTEHPAVKACVVTAQGAGDHDRRLIAHAVPHPGRQVTGEELRFHAASLLPHAMVPAAVVLLDAFPLTPNGKVDRTALPSPRGASGETSGGETGGGVPAPPLDAWERRVADAWCEILGIEDVGPDGDFFATGGDSLAAIRVVQLIDPHLPVAELFDHPTVRTLAARLRALEEER
ncbi:non-ribosomal peptide synthetase [Streptomyces sp. NPDC047981]|uniref:non-ribosomal peptide synthetase n=1 Tax=Streptomyces sp. NPDC047981 TaxID=3154610 RepID=UPI00343FD94B